MFPPQIRFLRVFVGFRETYPRSYSVSSSGKELFAIVARACAYAPAYDELRDETEDELVARFLQGAQDWGELGIESVAERIHAERFFDESIRELEQAGFWVFGGRERQILEGGTGPETDWPIAHIQVLRDTNPEIMVLLGLFGQGHGLKSRCMPE